MTSPNETNFEASPSALLLPGTVFAAVALVLFLSALLDGSSTPALDRLLYQLSAMLLVIGAGFLTASVTEAARRRGPFERREFSRRRAKLPSQRLQRLRAFHDKVRSDLANIDWQGDWYPILVAALPSALALRALYLAWNIAGPNPSAAFDEWVAASLIIAAFPVLVAERFLAQHSGQRAPEASSLARLIRVPILGLLALGIATGLRWLHIPWWTLIEHFADIVVGLVAAELLLRSFVHVFVPLAPIETRVSHADSLIAGLIHLQLPDLNAFNAVISERFGIDLARSWALAFVRRAALPVLLTMAAFSWLLTGVTALGLDQRAVYEAFGRPQTVFGPGLHVHLPWPFGLLRPVEYGTVHEVPIVFAANGSAETAAVSGSEEGTIEGPPPPSADRLWNAEHPSEAGYLVASVSNGKQNFEVADIDLRIVYRVGFTDQAARDVVYNVASPETMVRAAAGRMLARYFAKYSISDVLGQNREAFIHGFERELQARLAALDTGIEVMAVVVEAIHPPPAAAASYQGVQAAAIRAQIAIAGARASATFQMTDAQITAIRARNEAAAAAAERVDTAKAATALFAGDRQAYATAGQAFLFERRIEHLDTGLSKMPLIIVDHRIKRDDALTLDLRPFYNPALQ